MFESSPCILWCLLLFAGRRVTHLWQMGESCDHACVKLHLRMTGCPAPLLLAFSQGGEPAEKNRIEPQMRQFKCEGIIKSESLSTVCGQIGRLRTLASQKGVYLRRHPCMEAQAVKGLCVQYVQCVQQNPNPTRARAGKMTFHSRNQKIIYIVFKKQEFHCTYCTHGRIRYKVDIICIQQKDKEAAARTANAMAHFVRW